MDDANAMQQQRNKRRWNRCEFLEFLESYIACALRFSTDENGSSLGKTRDDITMKVYNAIHSDCVDFVTANHDDLYGLNPVQCGQDFFLSRNRHGAGFFDRGLGDLGDRLQAAARVYGEASLYVGDDFRLHYFG